jgi:hypothetical protein
MEKISWIRPCFWISKEKAKEIGSTLCPRTNSKQSDDQICDPSDSTTLIPLEDRIFDCVPKNLKEFSPLAENT